MAKKLIMVAVTMVVMGILVPVFWPMILDTNDAIQAIEGADAATAFLKAVWPIGVLVVGIGIAVGLIMYALRKFGVIGK